MSWRYASYRGLDNLVAPRIPEPEFIELFEKLGATALARKIGVGVRAVFERRQSLERKHKRRLETANTPRDIPAHPHRIELTIKSGVVLVGSDGHYWPDDDSPAHRAFVAFTKDERPVAVIQNGDVFDGASISRYPPIGWTRRPTVIEEIEAAQEKLAEIERAKPMRCRLLWSLGNHDSRFETRIASVAPEYAQVHGVSLQDHFPGWEPCWAIWINDDVVIKHRFKGGLHAPHNNTMWAGRTMITGHLHSAKVQPFSDYNGDRYGVDTGCLADIYGPQFRDYTEDSPRNWRSGFCVLTFKDGLLLQPELVLVVDENTVQFRGELIRV